MKKYVCRECGYVFSAENTEPDYTELVETDEPMEVYEDDGAILCPHCRGFADPAEK